MKLFADMVSMLNKRSSVTSQTSSPPICVTITTDDSTPDIFKPGTTPYQIFCMDLAKIAAGFWRFKLEVVGTSALLIVSLAAGVAGLWGSGIKSEMSEFTTRLKSETTTQLLNEVNKINDLVQPRLNSEVEKINALVLSKFKEDSIQKVIAEAAQGEAKGLLAAKVDPAIMAFNKRLAEFTASMMKKEQLATENLAKLADELESLKARNRLTRLADEVIGDGNSESLQEIERIITHDPLEPKTPTVMAAEAEYIRILVAYSSSIVRDPGVELANGKDEEMSPQKLLEGLLNVSLPANGRQRLAMLFKKKAHEKSWGQLEAVITLLQKETHLYVQQELKEHLFKVYGAPPFFQRPGKKYVLEWWEANKEKLKKELVPVP